MPNITPQIVDLNAIVTQAPTPSQLQQSGALVSFGGTTLATNNYQFCANLATVQSLLSGSGNHTELNNEAMTFFAQGNSAGVSLLELGAVSGVDAQIAALQAWITTHQIPQIFYAYLVPANFDSSKDQVGSVTITSAGSGYTAPPVVTFSAPGSGVTALGTSTIQNGAVTAVTITNPGSGYTVAPTATFAAPSGTTALATSVITGGAVTSTVITNPGAGYTTIPTVTFSAPDTGVTATGTAVITNGVLTSIVITLAGSGYTGAPTVTVSAPSGTTATGTVNLSSALAVMAANYESPTGKTYFFVSASTSDLTDYANIKSIFAVVPSILAPSTEFTAAAPFYQWLVNNPQASNRLAPMGYRYMFGVTPWIESQNQVTLTNILSLYGNYIGTGAEGGISNMTLFKGTMMDGNQASFWYGIDWIQIQIKQALAAAIINGSNRNPPLEYDPAGIRTLREIAQGVVNTARQFGCALSGTVTAIPFGTYIRQNPGDYTAGVYNGLSATVTGPSGFLTITFNLDAVQF